MLVSDTNALLKGSEVSSVSCDVQSLAFSARRWSATHYLMSTSPWTFSVFLYTFHIKITLKYDFNRPVEFESIILLHLLLPLMNIHVSVFSVVPDANWTTRLVGNIW